MPQLGGRAREIEREMSPNEKLSAHTQARKPWLHDILHVFSIAVSRYVVNIVETVAQLGGGEREVTK